MLDRPVLLITYKRKDTTLAVLEALKKVKPSKLYFASNAPNPASSTDEAKVAEVRALTELIDWPCEIKTLFRTEHLPAKKSIVSSIDWLFEHEEAGIILEDDCVPETSFFQYCDEMLAKYQDDPDVMHISASNFDDSDQWTPDAYFFSKYCFIWGWATWARAWKAFQEVTTDRRAFKDIVASNFDAPEERSYWLAAFDYLQSGNIDTWDYNWNFAVWEKNGLAITPGANQISNIGFGMDATNTVSGGDKYSNQKTSALRFPLNAPLERAPNAEFEFRQREAAYNVLKSARTMHLKMRIASRLPANFNRFVKKQIAKLG